jgi:hypothetical protein
MNNIINNWDYVKPTEPGDYLICLGDVETEANVYFERITELHGELVDRDGDKIADYNSAHKYARLVYSPVEIKGLDDA